MKVKLLEVKHDVEDIFKKGEKLYQSFLYKDYYYNLENKSPVAAFDIKIADAHGGRDKFFKDIGTMEHKDTPLFIVTKEVNEQRLEEIMEEIEEAKGSLKILMKERDILQEVLA